MMEKPNYFAIMTADVRYSELINANQKLLYAEITALTNHSGVCWASNNYFSELYNVTPQAISKWVTLLKKNGFIDVSYVYKEGSKEILKREIRCINNGLIGINNGLKGYQHTIKDNNIIYNNNIIDSNLDTKTNIDFDALLVFFNKVTSKKIKVVNAKAKTQLNARIKEGYTKQDIAKAITNCFNDKYHKENPHFLTLEFISRPDKFEKYFNMECKYGFSDEDVKKRKREELLKSMGI